MRVQDFATDMTGYVDNGIDKTTFVCSGLIAQAKNAKEEHMLFQIAILNTDTLVVTKNMFILFKLKDGELNLFYNGEYYLVTYSDMHSFIVTDGLNNFTFKVRHSIV